jgi:hypothetical protein
VEEESRRRVAVGRREPRRKRNSGALQWVREEEGIAARRSHVLAGGPPSARTGWWLVRCYLNNPQSQAQLKLKVSKTQTSNMVFGSSSKRKRADELEDDDVQVVQEVPVDIQDGGADADSGDEDGAAATGTRHPLLDEINIIGVPSGKNVGGTKE